MTRSRDQHDAGGPLAAGQWLARGTLNRWAGWALLVVGFGLGAWLDPWSLGERDPAQLFETHRLHARHAQAVLVASAFLQLAVSFVLAEARSPRFAVAVSAALTAAGTATYVVGYGAGTIWPVALWLVPCGAVANLAAFGTLLLVLPATPGCRPLRMILGILCFGMGLNFAMGLFAAGPDQLVPQYLGQLDGVRMRMLRLARAAVIALSVLCLFYRELSTAASVKGPLIRWGGSLLLLGAIAMPLILVLAAVIHLPLKYLLGLPAQLVLAGTLIGCWLAMRRGSRLATCGWCLVALSMGEGLLMGLYAFDGPLPTPELLGEYNDFNRRLSRLGHAYWIVQGLTAIFLATSAIPGGQRAQALDRLAGLLLVLGVAATTATIILATVFSQAVSFLGIGAFLSALSVACIGGWETRRAFFQGS